MNNRAVLGNILVTFISTIVIILILAVFMAFSGAFKIAGDGRDINAGVERNIRSQFYSSENLHWYITDFFSVAELKYLLADKKFIEALNAFSKDSNKKEELKNAIVNSGQFYFTVQIEKGTDIICCQRNSDNGNKILCKDEKCYYMNDEPNVWPALKFDIYGLVLKTRHNKLIIFTKRGGGDYD